eukprot:5212972-Alexandrium_andersonii.AAC.1
MLRPAGRSDRRRDSNAWLASSPRRETDLGAARPWRCRYRACHERKEPGGAPADSSAARTAAQAADRRMGAALSRAARAKSS